MSDFIASHGGVLAVSLSIVVCFNVLMSAIKTFCDIWKIKEPSVLQKMAAVGSTLASWLSANTKAAVPPAAAPVPAVQEEQKPAA